MSIAVCFGGSAWYSRLKYLASAPAALPTVDEVSLCPCAPSCLECVREQVRARMEGREGTKCVELVRAHMEGRE